MPTRGYIPSRFHFQLLALLLASAAVLHGCGDGGGGDGDGLSPADGAPLDRGKADRQVVDEGPAIDGPGAADSAPPDDGGLTTDSSVALDAGVPDWSQPLDTAPPDGPVAAPDGSAATLSGCIKGNFKPYFGNLHAHTSYSDGKKTPKDAFKHARDVAKLDIQVITDHLEQLYLPFPLDKYGKCISQAKGETKAGKFLAACGFEYGSAFTIKLTSAGHANVFFSPKLLPAIQTNFKDFYKSLAGCSTCIGQFNHPADEKDQHFDNFKYNAAADAKINLFEFNSSPAWTYFFKALDNGWHLSPTYNQDNHSADWGSKNDRRSGLLMAALDMQSMKQAMSQRRTFMSEDKNASITLMAGNCWMGSILKGAAAMTLSVKATDADSAEAFTSVELYGKGTKLLASTACKVSNPCAVSFQVKASQSAYFVARAKQKDGDTLVSAPIWLAP